MKKNRTTIAAGFGAFCAMCISAHAVFADEKTFPLIYGGLGSATLNTDPIDISVLMKFETVRSGSDEIAIVIDTGVDRDIPGYQRKTPVLLRFGGRQHQVDAPDWYSGIAQGKEFYPLRTGIVSSLKQSEFVQDAGHFFTDSFAIFSEEEKRLAEQNFYSGSYISILEKRSDISLRKSIFHSIVNNPRMKLEVLEPVKSKMSTKSFSVDILDSDGNVSKRNLSELIQEVEWLRYRRERRQAEAAQVRKLRADLIQIVNEQKVDSDPQLSSMRDSVRTEITSLETMFRKLNEWEIANWFEKAALNRHAQMILDSVN